MKLGNIKKFFPRKAKSLDEFIFLVRSRGGRSVEAKPFIKEHFYWGDTNDPLIPHSGRKTFGVTLHSNPENERPITYTKKITGYKGRDFEYADSGTIKTTNHVEALTTTVEKSKTILETIESEMPGIMTHLYGFNGGKIDKKESQKIREYAEKRRIRTTL